MTELLERYGVLLLFASVFAEQVGLPIPAIPAMMIAGAMAIEGRINAPAALTAIIVASVLADGLCFAIGRRYGWRVMRVLCTVSLSPDACVRQTSGYFERWGGWTLVIGKFVPGIATIAPPLAGITGMSWRRFLYLSAVGSSLWAGVGMGAGALLHNQVTGALQFIERLGAHAGALVAIAALLYLVFKWWRRERFLRTLRMARISVAELRSLFGLQVAPLVVDLRPRGDREREGAIPGAQAVELPDVTTHLAAFPKDREIVFFCSCPNGVSAASAAKTLVDLGYTRVRPLAGGFQAWVAAGYSIALPSVERS